MISHKYAILRGRSVILVGYGAIVAEAWQRVNIDHVSLRSSVNVMVSPLLSGYKAAKRWHVCQTQHERNHDAEYHRIRDAGHLALRHFGDVQTLAC